MTRRRDAGAQRPAAMATGSATAQSVRVFCDVLFIAGAIVRGCREKGKNKIVKICRRSQVHGSAGQPGRDHKPSTRAKGMRIGELRYLPVGKQRLWRCAMNVAVSMLWPSIRGTATVSKDSSAGFRVCSAPLTASMWMVGRLLALLVLVGTVALSASLAGDYVGVSSSCVNGDCIVGASSSPGSVMISLAIIGFVVFQPEWKSQIDTSRAVGVWRRFGAFFIDFLLVLLAVAPLTTLPMLFAEAAHTGEFHWSFIRDFGRPNDTLFVLPAVLLGFASLYFYFFYLPWKSKQTVGEYILGFKIVAASGQGFSPNYALRPMMSFIGLCAWPVSVFLALRNEDKRFWWDTKSRTRAVIVSSSRDR